MDGTALMRQVRKGLFQVFLQGQNPIGNKAFWGISDMFQLREHLPIPELLFTPFLELEVDGLSQAAVPGNEQHVKLALDTDMLAVEQADAVAGWQAALRPREQGIAMFERLANPANCRRVRNAPTRAKPAICRPIFRIRLNRRPVSCVSPSSTKSLSALLAQPSGPSVFHCFPSIAVRACWVFHALFRAEKG